MEHFQYVTRVPIFRYFINILYAISFFTKFYLCMNGQQGITESSTGAQVWSQIFIIYLLHSYTTDTSALPDINARA